MSEPKYWTKKYKVAFVVGGLIASGAFFWGFGFYAFLISPLRSLAVLLVSFVVGGFISVFLVAMETLDEKPTGYH